MKKTLLFFMLFLGLSYFCEAQPGGRGKKIEAIKVAYITKELNLTSGEAQKFWPVYNEYFEELKKARMENRNDELAFEEKALAIRKKYKADFKKALGDDSRVNRVFTIDRDFQEMLRKAMQNRQKGKRNGGPNVPADDLD
jgi:Skp family chaperone for outer membrane proteins